MQIKAPKIGDTVMYRRSSSSDPQYTPGDEDTPLYMMPHTERYKEYTGIVTDTYVLFDNTSTLFIDLDVFTKTGNSRFYGVPHSDTLTDCWYWPNKPDEFLTLEDPATIFVGEYPF